MPRQLAEDLGVVPIKGRLPQVVQAGIKVATVVDDQSPATLIPSQHGTVRIELRTCGWGRG